MSLWAGQIAFLAIMSMLIVFFAFTHATNGLRMIVEDYMGHTVWQPILRGYSPALAVHDNRRSVCHPIILTAECRCEEIINEKAPI